MSVTLRLGTDAADLERAAALLLAGELVAVPTETVYGLAVRADDAEAVGRLFVAKGRPADNPLIVHVARIEDVLLVARELTPIAQRLLDALAPGPITVVLPARDDLPREVTGGLDTVAVRIPDHPVTLELLHRSGVPLAAPSANRSGRPSPTRAEHVLADLDGRIAAVVDAGPTRVGLESTVVDTRGPGWRMLRAGGVDRATIRAALGTPEDGRDEEDGEDAADPVRSPGSRHPHYAPTLPVHLAAPGTGPELAARLARATGTVDARVGLVAVRDDGRLTHSGDAVRVLAVPRDVTELAATLFMLLREAEAERLDALVIETVADEGIGGAVMDRLRRAADASGGAGAP